MESADAAQGGTEAQATAEQADDGQQQDQFAPIMERLDQLSGELSELREPAYDDAYYQDDTQQDEYVDPQLDAEQVYDQEGQVDPQAAQEYLQQLIDQRANEAIRPALEQVENLRIEQDARGLEEQYPELRSYEGAQQALEAAQEAAERVGDPRLARQPGFIELAYLADRARTQAEQEVPAGQSDGLLEAAGGAAPQAPDESDIGQRIVNAGGDSSQFWGF